MSCIRYTIITTLTANNMEAKETVFDKILEQIGSYGKFQKIFVYVFNFALVVFTWMCYLNVTLALAVPEHWCHVPGRNGTNFTMEEWKNLTLPKGQGSECKMYNSFYDSETGAVNRNTTETGCKHWDYDQRWYEQTISSENNWVCDRKENVTNALVFSRIGDVLGIIIFGQLGDLIGRKPIYYIALVILIIARFSASFVSSIYYLLTMSMITGSLTVPAVYQSTLITAMEITTDDNRSFIAMLQCFGITLGSCLLPLLQWSLGRWFNFMLATTVPCLLFFTLYKYMIESPRWLASKGKIEESIKELEKIAQVNGKSVPQNSEQLLKKNYNELKEKSYGILSLFSNQRLAKNTFIVTFCWLITSATYYFLILNIGEVGGNPHLIFFCQSLSEYPGNVLGRYLCDKYGRRWTAVIMFFATAIAFIPLIIFTMHLESTWLSITLVVTVKFTLTICTFANIVQSVEIYPTCVRQSGQSLGYFVANLFCITVPYLNDMGRDFDVRFPYITLASFFVVGGMAAFFLPETLNRKLPETLAETHDFGTDQELWTFSFKSEQC